MCSDQKWERQKGSKKERKAERKAERKKKKKKKERKKGKIAEEENILTSGLIYRIFGYFNKKFFLRLVVVL